MSQHLDIQFRYRAIHPYLSHLSDAKKLQGYIIPLCHPMHSKLPAITCSYASSEEEITTGTLDFML
jgi:hypothetical protein